MTRPCDDYEILLEQRAAGALDADERAELAAHLSGCPACTAYAARMRPAAELLPPAVAEPTDWAVIRDRMTSARDGYRRQMRRWWTAGLPAMVAAGAICLPFTDRPRTLAVAMVVFIAVFAAIVTTAQRARLRQLEELGRRSDVIGAWRGQLQGNLKVWRMARWFAGLAIVANAMLIPSSTGFWLAARLAMMASFAFTLIAVYRAAREARRNLAELR